MVEGVQQGPVLVGTFFTTAAYASFRVPTAVRNRKSPKSPILFEVGSKVKA